MDFIRGSYGMDQIFTTLNSPPNIDTAHSSIRKKPHSIQYNVKFYIMK